VRRVRYQVAASLDGFIADSAGGYDWIPPSDFDFVAHFAQFDTFLMGRRTFETLPQGTPITGEVVVFSRTLRPEDHPGVRIVADGAGEVVRALRAKPSPPGKDIWLFGGGELFRSLLDLGEVDTVEIAVMPVLLGDGTPLLPGDRRTKLALTGHRCDSKSGICLLEYRVVRE
jgi:dihydrofolate reductase